MKNSIFTLPIILAAFSTSVLAQNIDSMQHRLDTAKDVCIKAELYTNISAALIQFNLPKTRIITNADANKAVDYALKAIHFNNKFDDTLAVRNNLDCLSEAYLLQKKYTQAKWFALQSAGISRDRRDVPHIIKSLMQTARIKTIIQDYKLAEKDFNEAIVLSKYENNIPLEIEVEKNLAALYDKQGKLKSAEQLVERYSLLSENLQKANLRKYYAMLKVKAKKHTTLNEAKQISEVQDIQETDTKMGLTDDVQKNMIVNTNN